MIPKELERLKNIMTDQELTCVISANGALYQSRERGLSLFAVFSKKNVDLCGGYAADKVIGKAAAMLYVLLKIKAVYAKTISTPALEVFKKHGIECFFDLQAEAIRNRSNTGFCPMETAVKDISDPKKAFEAIKQTLKRLNS